MLHFTDAIVGIIIELHQIFWVVLTVGEAAAVAATDVDDQFFFDLVGLATDRLVEDHLLELVRHQVLDQMSLTVDFDHRWLIGDFDDLGFIFWLKGTFELL